MASPTPRAAGAAEAGAREALGTVDPTPYFQKYGENLWAAVKGYLDAVADAAAGPPLCTPITGRSLCQSLVSADART